ncbi:hypothetical protein QAD02_023639 [Eretmocerus hayati]|uniref:Uncharacterized protein n=1 Tax=Eretmocerus hayati TaxID=131215 RepID=A0ACC2PYV5_9HYME|nr:hypothetical protein QAD02_023639 [Eretmocerus hayati]
MCRELRGTQGMASKAKNCSLGVSGGYVTDITRHPYEVMIQGSYYVLINVHCTGSIIAPHYVITTAMCANQARSWSSRVRAGTNKKQQGGSLHRIQQVNIHEDWNGNILNNIALIRVREPFLYDKTRQRIRLSEPNNHFEYDDSIATVSGWGKSYSLQAINVTIVDDENMCSQLFPFGFLKDRDLCALNIDRDEIHDFKVGPCYGDSGAPLVVAERLIGIFSHTYPTCGIDDPQAYIGVAYYRDWINHRVEYSITDLDYEEDDDSILIISLRLFTCAAFHRLLW